MTIIIEFPRPAGKTSHPTTDGSAISDTVLHELIRKAVIAHRAGEARVLGSLGHRHHRAVSAAILDAVQTILGTSGVAQELGQCMENGITDVRKLSRIAREFDGPQSA